MGFGRTVLGMEDRSRWVYDERASEAEHMDVVHEYVLHDRSEHVAAWVQAMRRLNSIEDPLARKILALHRDCDGGIGNCDACESEDGESVGLTWPCETTEVIAQHFGIEYPGRPDGAEPEQS